MKSLDRKKAAHPLISRIRVWMELGGKKNGRSGSVEVGEATTLGIRALLPGSVGVRIVDCSALDGIGETSQKLLDHQGCPVDAQVCTSLIIKMRNASSRETGPPTQTSCRDKQFPRRAPRVPRSSAPNRPVIAVCAAPVIPFGVATFAFAAHP